MNQYSNSLQAAQQKQSESIPSRSPIDERAMQLEYELRMLDEVIQHLVMKIDNIMRPKSPSDPTAKGINTSTPVMSVMTRALDNATNGVMLQRIALEEMIERIEL